MRHFALYFKISQDCNKKAKNMNKEENNIEESENLIDQTQSEEDRLLSEEKQHEETIAKLISQTEVLQDKLLRSMAEAENIRLRSNKMIEEAKDYSIVSFAKDLVPIIDHFSKALEHIPEKIDKETQNVVEGIKMTKQELENVFKKHSLESIEPNIGDKFDYNNHHAISQIVTEEYNAGTIVSIMQVGYKIRDRLIRPAAVVVAKK